MAPKRQPVRVTYAGGRFLGLQDTVFASSYAGPFTPEQCFAPGGPPATSPPGQARPPPSRQVYYDDYISGDVDFSAVPARPSLTTTRSISSAIRVAR